MHGVMYKKRVLELVSTTLGKFDYRRDAGPLRPAQFYYPEAREPVIKDMCSPVWGRLVGVTAASFTVYTTDSV